MTQGLNSSTQGRVFDSADLERVTRGFIAARTENQIVDDKGRKVIDTAAYDFLRDGRDAPDTVNPHLWRHATLNAHHGLFEVANGVWQVRGYDISNITFIQGDKGWVVIDPLTSDYTARASLELINQHVGERPVTGVIYTHSHADHFGGVLGVTTRADVDAGKCVVIAPEGFCMRRLLKTSLQGLQ